MNIKNRIKKLEQRPGATEPRAFIVYVRDANSEAEAAEAAKRGDTVIEYVPAKERAIAEYKALHPDWEPSSKDFYLCCVSEEGKRNVERLIAGEVPALRA